MACMKQPSIIFFFGFLSIILLLHVSCFCVCFFYICLDGNIKRVIIQLLWKIFACFICVQLFKWFLVRFLAISNCRFF